MTTLPRQRDRDRGLIANARAGRRTVWRMTADLAAAIDRVMPSVRADLEDLVRIRSVSADPARAADVRAAAAATAALFEAEGFDVSIVSASADGVHGAPAVIARKPAPEGRPTVLLYAHHDVQPTGDEKLWTSPPFEPTERHGRLYARGAADDKAGIAAHLAAIRAFGNDLPVGVTVFVEGEEEIGSPTIKQLLAEHRDALAADAIVIADSTNWMIGQPALSTSLRGLVNCVVEVRTLEHAVHSGMYGGAAPDALTTLCRLLATLHTAVGDVAVDGLHAGRAADLDYPDARFREEAGVPDGVKLIGSGSLPDRIWTRPSISVIAIDAPSVADASNTLIPVARAKVSMRVAPGDDAEKAKDALVAHLQDNVEWGASVEVDEFEVGQPFAVNPNGPSYDAARNAFATAWGVQPVDIGIGGSIPFIAEFADAFPAAAILVTGIEDPDTRAHGIDEGLHLAEFTKACVAEAELLRNLSAAPPA
jgi:acetylornithine deacetylase/succinyl-diaminopimelate desuccinylase-like protein